MLRDFTLELVSAPGSGATITLPGAAPAGRITWAAAYGGASQTFVFYVLDDSVQQEWGVGSLTIGAPSTITRPTVVLGNSAGTTSRLNFTTTTRCYSSLPSRPALAGMYNNIGRNYLHNPMFRIQQRGIGGWSASGSYTADRWRISMSLDTVAVSITPFSVTGVTNDEEAGSALLVSCTGNAGAGAFTFLDQCIENVKRLSAKTITISFVGYVTSGTAKIGVGIRQNFGTGGAPSAQVIPNSTPVTLTTTPTRYSVTIAVPSIAGKTLGTNGDHYTQLGLYFSSGSTNNTVAGGIGVQAANFVLWGMQLEQGAVPTPLEKIDFAQDLANCQRFYQTGFFQLTAYGTAGAFLSYVQPILPMRVAPTLTITSSTNTNCTGSPTVASASALTVAATVTATGIILSNGNFTASADF